ncbi:xanthine dehydrogenase family protein subunit M [Alkalihalophilus lindianensis]|uniref:Xanthine dehydrogenase family protein subunit M n=1 Tax=Alkalihalophilus lindianensis TaxID=1630542 RepID=A0ABU3X836_9BACI|nr:xanthine dehydrogenase family protein subunit M [Alkalihalophilus lindianensis]MDV2684046.1 xanthine dehydrogenase family protein subunit M [Alkalihalophilus lindianensis]
MISFDFEYYKPTSINEATQLFQSLVEQGKEPIYFSGGTEVITLGRINQIQTDAVIDIKGIPECMILKKDEKKVTLGAAQSLNKIHEMQFFPFLNKAIVEIADHTARNKITLGGNICANIIYRETVLPLLLTNSEVVIASPNGLKQVPLQGVFHQKLNLEKGEFLVQVTTEQSEIDCPFVCVKKRRQWDVGYPLITTAALKKEGYIKVAFSGLSDFPIYDPMIEKSLNNKQLSKEERVEQALQQIFVPILDDVNGSAEYRLFVLKNTLLDVLDELEGVGHV